MQQNKETTVARPGLLFELEFTGDTGCVKVSQLAQLPQRRPAPRQLNSQLFERYKETFRAQFNTLGLVVQEPRSIAEVTRFTNEKRARSGPIIRKYDTGWIRPLAASSPPGLP
jgi:hypothetical protein